MPKVVVSYQLGQPTQIILCACHSAMMCAQVCAIVRLSALIKWILSLYYDEIIPIDSGSSYNSSVSEFDVLTT